ncbi:signal protein [Idiomarina xiamenensis 10-D-4]|uniref:cyclic-guanylate-specific phosphodiesterase n=2 Tax=Idiomarina xiamenensis TaxID=1207041 RepID=K2JMZ9_9GAMM|nr:signal protein [Idiomarina xiamenensis 10-D-4]
MKYFNHSKQAVIAMVAGVILTLALFFYLQHEETKQVKQYLGAEAQSIKRKIRQDLISHLFMVEWIGRDWANSERDMQQRWRDEALAISLYFKSVRTLAWLDSDLTILQVHPEQGNYQLLGQQFADSPLLNRLPLSLNNQHAMIGDAGNLGSQNTDLAMLMRIPQGDKHYFLAVVISLQDLFNHIVRTNISEGYQLRITQQQRLIYQFQGDTDLLDSHGVNVDVQALTNNWQLTLWPTQRKLSSMTGHTPIVMLVVGFFTTLLIAFVLSVLTGSRKRAQELADTNLDLYAEIEERERVEKQMAYLAEHDWLTHLANRNALLRFLEEHIELSQQQSTRLAVLFIDLDRFKEVNDALGHTVGDELLKRVARRLQKIIPKQAYLARTGGDEFVIAVPDIIHQEDVIDITNQLLVALDTHFYVDDYELFISASIGIAFAEDADYSAENLIRNADTSLYQAKENGRNTYHLYNKSLHRDLTDKLELMKRLRHAVDEEKLEVYYQPKVELTSRRIVGLEALVRWIEDDGQVIGPDRFIPIAEDTGLIIPISNFVMRRACEQLKLWHDLGYDELSMAINISGKQLHSPDLMERVLESIHHAQIPAKKLELELTEQVFIENIQSHTNFMHSIREHGIALAIDDFGVGYSSLAYLKNFPVSSLKIDRSFVQDLPHDNDDATITQTIINLAKNLDLDVVAEGVETEAQVDFLLARDCVIGQGYLFSKPIPAQQMTRLLQQYQGLIPIEIA